MSPYCTLAMSATATPPTVKLQLAMFKTLFTPPLASSGLSKVTTNWVGPTAKLLSSYSGASELAAPAVALVGA